MRAISSRLSHDEVDDGASAELTTHLMVTDGENLTEEPALLLFGRRFL